MHSQGMQFGLSAQGTDMVNLLISDPIPRQQLNNFLFIALCPVIATIGPWSGGYGLQSDNMEVSVMVTSDAHGIHFTQQAGSVPTSSVVLEELHESDASIYPRDNNDRSPN